MFIFADFSYDWFTKMYDLLFVRSFARERERDRDSLTRMCKHSQNVRMRKERRTDAQCDIKWENHHEKEH